MDCDEIKKIIPSYIKHTASEHEAKGVEAHLCICDSCRKYLSDLMDNPPVETPPETKEEAKEEVAAPQKKSKSKDVGIVEYAIVGVSAAMFLFFIYLFMKGS
jgi:predicted anti-sigma-YlaC factor YlaD